MGGCRCVFRDCTVSTTHHPKMHFFHFPVKNRIRFQKWVEMAGNEQIVALPIMQQKNRVVCARHFRDECFMNYKRDKLVATAVPTLTRLNETLALDYDATDAEGVPRLLTLERPKLAHLIPPEGFDCPLELDVGNGASEVELMQLQTEQQNELDAELHDSNDSIWQEIVMDVKRSCPEPEVPTTKRQTCVNKNTAATKDVLHIPSKRNVSVKHRNSELRHGVIDVQSPQHVVLLNDVSTEEQVEVYEIDLLEPIDVDSLTDLPLTHVEESIDDSLQQHKKECAQLQVEIDDEREQHGAVTDAFPVRIQQLESELQQAQNELVKTLQQLKSSLAENAQLIEKNKTLAQKNDELSTSARNLNQKHKSLQNKYSSLEREHGSLQQEHVIIQENYKQLAEQQQQVHTVSTSKECGASDNNSSSSTNPQTQTFSKVQLFNGIKKYLGASMVSLVRMEMFGNADREWKPDERRVAVDLLQLGEQYYKYFSDEWRFRLPALRQVREWLNESVVDEEEDL